MPARCTRAPESAGLLVRCLLVAVLPLAGAIGCSRSDAGDDPVVGTGDTAGDDVRVEMNVTPRPPVTGKVGVEISILDAQGRPLPATSVELEGNMSHPGMTPSFATARPEQPGRWRAELELTMGGDWVVQVDAQLADGRSIQRLVPLPGVESR